jgi:integral membrane protein
MLRIFQQVALWEAISAILLYFIAMPIKYILPYFMSIPDDIRNGAVRIAGSIHGFLFVIFAILLIMCWHTYNWKLNRVAKYLVISQIPILSFWVERDIKKDILNNTKASM